MAFDEEELYRIYRRTDGCCHICGKKLSFVNYNQPRKKGAWEIEHSIPKAKGGSDHLHNLFPACISCNRSKGTRTSRTARSWHGRKRAPLSKEKKNKIKKSNTVAFGIIGGLIGALGGPAGVAIGAGLGAWLGSSLNPEGNE